jgi:hypothetical protein
MEQKNNGSENFEMFNQNLREFTLDGKSSIEYRFLDNSTQEIQDQMNAYFTKEVFSKYLEMAKKRQMNYYGKTDTWSYEALKKYPITDQEVCIFGSANPWYEAIALQHGAKKCDVIEYSNRESFDERITYIKPEDQYSKVYTMAFSISSFEHDGLGRYGDPISPNADILAMQNAKKIINKGGLLFFAVPVGKDKICFNVHRIYGKHRLPKMFEGWEVIASFGFKNKDFESEINNVSGTPYQPIFVLKNL